MMSTANLDESSIAAVIGDWHGDRSWANARLQSLGERGVSVALHAGDFGIWPGPSGKAFLQSVEKVCARYDIAVLVTPGNHEHWSRINQLWENPKNREADGERRPLYLTEHVAVLPRGYRWSMHGRSFVSLGGAPSVDFLSRRQGKDWWPEEQMTQEDVDRTIAGGYADVMITHDAPGPPWATRAVEDIVTTNPMSWTDRALSYATEGRDLVTAAFLGVAPRLQVHAHYHCSGQRTVTLSGAGYDTEIWSLDCNGKAGNMRLLDLATLTDPVKAGR
ncbi:metallophosphoesterase [Nocardioides sp. URHA0020]|uniref:metallophosphoesterase n=1 Tax=Nocardioides sp. URHA0020 TaxID=1380392 RepID=UPI00048FF4D9|nr:metallophosphoesterase [Nocardioides sp. URHA0020]